MVSESSPHLIQYGFMSIDAWVCPYRGSLFWFIWCVEKQRLPIFLYRREYEYGFWRHRVEADIFSGIPRVTGFPRDVVVVVVVDGSGWGMANKVWHCFPCKTPRKHWHLTCFEIKNLADLRSLPFALSLCLPCIYFLCRIADSVLGNFWSCSVDPGHLFFSLFCHDSYSGHAVHLPKILPVSPAATSLSFLFSSAPSPSFPPFSSARHSKRSLGFLSLHLSHYTPVFQSRLNWERLTRAHKELALRPREMKLNLLQVTLGENKQQM